MMIRSRVEFVIHQEPTEVKRSVAEQPNFLQDASDCIPYVEHLEMVILIPSSYHRQPQLRCDEI
jgi:hypothetical protein